MTFVTTQAANWASVFSGMRDLGVRGDVTILLSVLNPNRLDAMVSSAEAAI